MSMNYNLIDKTWIPALFKSGQIEELGLRNLLARAHEIREVAHDSPLFVASITTLLVALLQSAWLGETQRQREREWKRLWEGKRFDADWLDAYFEKWHDRFDLFHPQFPFYQTANLEIANSRPLQELAIEENNGAIFANIYNPEWQSASPAVAAQILISNQNFAIPGGITSDAVINGKPAKTPNFASGPLAGGLVIWPSGDSLFETLMLNTVPFELLPDDKPVWELDNAVDLRDVPLGKVKDDKGNENTQRKIHPVKGICDWLTLQSRMVLLNPKSDQGQQFVDGLVITQGRSYDASGITRLHPFKVYQKQEKTGYITLDINVDKAIWRNSATLLSRGNIERDEMNSLRFVSRLRTEGFLGANFHTTLNVVGIAKKKAHVFLWRHDRLPVPASLLADENTESNLQLAIEDAERLAIEMKNRFRIVCTTLLAPEVEGVRRGILIKPDSKNVDNLADKFDPRRAYWPRLETPFLEFLAQLPTNYATANDAWRASVEQAANVAFAEACNSLGDGPRAVVAVAQVYPTFSLEFLEAQKNRRVIKSKTPVAA